MEGGTSVEKDCSALGGLFQAVINDMRGSSPIWEDFTYKATKLHSSLKTTLIAISTFLDAFQKVADMATGSRGATKEIGTSLTRLCMRHRSIEGKLKTFTNSILDSLVVPLQEKLEDWKKVVAQLDKDHAKEYKKARQEIKKAASDTVRLQKKVKKGKGDMQNRLDNAMQDVNDKYLLLEESEKNAVRTALIEERSRYCLFVASVKPFVDSEISLLTEVTHLQEIIDNVCMQASDPTVLPQSSEQVILDIKGVDHSVWNFQQTPPSSPSSLGSRKSSMCSISSINSSSSGSTKSHSPSHHNMRNRTTSKTSCSDKESTSTDTPDVDSTPTTPSEHYPTTPSACSTWNNWPNLPTNVPKNEAFRPHTISSAYEKSYHTRPALKAELFEPPPPEMLEKPKEDLETRTDPRGVKVQRPHSTINASPYARPSATINKMQPVLPPLGPKPKPKAVPPPMVPNMEQPIYANAEEIAKAAAMKHEAQVVHSPESDQSSSPPTPSNNAAAQIHQNSLELAEAIRELEASTAALECTYDSKSYTSRTSLQCSSGYGTMNSTPSGSEDTIASGDFDIASGATEPDQEKYYTIPRSRDVHAVYRAVLQPKRPASTAGIPVSHSGNSLSRRRSVNTPKPPPPVRRTSSMSTGSPPPVALKLRTSPPKQTSAPTQGPPVQHKRTPSGHSKTEGPYAELQLIQQSIHAKTRSKQPKPVPHLHPQRHASHKQQEHHGALRSPNYAPSSGSSHYAVTGIPANSTQTVSNQANVIQSLNAKFLALNTQHETVEDEDFPLPPTEEELQEIEKTYSKPPPVMAKPKDSLVLELKRRVTSDVSDA